jgi:hypothetical protein
MTECWRRGLLLLVFSVVQGRGLGQTTVDLPVNQATSYKGEEFLLIGEPNRGAGEPVIALDPSNANVILVGAMADLNHVEGEAVPTSFEKLNWNNVVTYGNTRDASVGRFALTHDRGRTWQIFDAPFRAFSR